MRLSYLFLIIFIHAVVGAPLGLLSRVKRSGVINMIQTSAQTNEIGQYGSTVTCPSTISNCDNCIDITLDPSNPQAQCTQCSSGFSFRNGDSNNECIPCDAATCNNLCVAPNVCACPNGQYNIINNNLPTTQCAPCSVQYCDKCSTDGSTCSSCSSGYYLDSSSNRCIPCNSIDSNCLECDGPNPDLAFPPKCRVCGKGFGVPRDGFGCSACDSLTDHYNDPFTNTCTSCAHRYNDRVSTCNDQRALTCIKDRYIADSSGCVNCKTYIDGCNSCTYSLDSDNKVVTDSIQCTKCSKFYTNSVLTKETANNLGVQYTPCVSCPAGCSACVSATCSDSQLDCPLCTSCQDGSIPVSGTCPVPANEIANTNDLDSAPSSNLMEMEAPPSAPACVTLAYRYRSLKMTVEPSFGSTPGVCNFEVGKTFRLFNNNERNSNANDLFIASRQGAYMSANNLEAQGSCAKTGQSTLCSCSATNKNCMDVIVLRPNTFYGVQIEEGNQQRFQKECATRKGGCDNHYFTIFVDPNGQTAYVIDTAAGAYPYRVTTTSVSGLYGLFNALNAKKASDPNYKIIEANAIYAKAFTRVTVAGPFKQKCAQMLSSSNVNDRICQIVGPSYKSYGPNPRNKNQPSCK